eukprot:PhF_6_TR37850/c0_g1_i1/m.56364
MSGQLVISVQKGRNLLPCDTNGLSDPFVTVSLGNHIVQTKVQNSTLTPTWNETFAFHTPHEEVTITVEVRDKDLVSASDFMGKCELTFGENTMYGTVGEGWIALQGRNQKDYQMARTRNGVHCFGEVYVQWWFSFSPFGKLFLPGNMTGKDSDAAYHVVEEQKPTFEMDAMKEGINRFFNAVYYLCVPYWWAMSHFMWDNVVESGASLFVILILYWYGRLHILLPLTMSLSMITTYYRFYRYGPDGPPLTAARPYSMSETVDWYKDTLHMVQIYCGWFSDIFDNVNDIFYWYKPATSKTLFTITSSIVGLYAVGLMPSASFLGCIILVYLFTLYPLAYYFPVFYAKITRSEVVEDIEDLKDGEEGSQQGSPDTPRNTPPISSPASPLHPKGSHFNAPGQEKLIEFTDVPSSHYCPQPEWRDKKIVEKCYSCKSSFGVMLQRKHCRCY